MNETLKSIRDRRSTRIFLPEQIKDNELQDIVEAGIYAPSATNKQPWHFTIIQNKEVIDRLNQGFKDTAKSSDNAYIKRFASNDKFHVFYNAPTVILVSGDVNNNYASVDCAAATQNMLIAAESLDIGTCWIGLIAYFLNGKEGSDMVKELGIPEGYKQIHAISVGYKKIKSATAPKRKENSVNYIK